MTREGDARRGNLKGACLMVLCLAMACGPDHRPATPNPTPVLKSIAPDSATRGGPALTLTVNGSGFAPASVVRWDGTTLPTTFVNSERLAAQVPADHLLVAEGHEVTVFSPAPGGGTSTALTFTIPCVLAPPTAASSQSRARIGAYYFDGWTGTLSNFHFAGLPHGGFTGREPLSGWQDGNVCAVEQQLAWARSFGLSFFVFDWYFNAAIVDTTGEDLNSAIQITRALPDRHGMQYAILYVDSPPFTISSHAEWNSAVDEWIGYMTDSAYVRVNGKPLFIVIDFGGMRAALGSSAAVNAAFGQLRSAAQARGLPGVYVVAGFGVPGGSAGQDALFPDLSGLAADGYDAVTTYNYPNAPPQVPGARPFTELVDAGRWIWTQAAAKSPLPVLPVVTDGWDPRPWTPSTSTWYVRDPIEVAAFVADVVDIAESSPRVRPEPSPSPPLVLMEAWNEVGEGSYVLPTVGDGSSYGEALAAMLLQPVTRVRTVLTLEDTGPADPHRRASGRLTDESGLAVTSASVELVATPLDGPGLFTQYSLSGKVPPGAETAVVGFRVNYEGAGPAACEFSLYRVSYVDPANGAEHVVNGDFSSGAQSWGLGGQAVFAPSDRGTGQRVVVQASSTQQASLTSAPFPVVANSGFRASFDARVSPSSAGSGYFTVIFLRSDVEFLREEAAFEPPSVPLGSPNTDAAGDYALDVSTLGAARVILEASYPGDAHAWPAYARLAP